MTTPEFLLELRGLDVEVWLEGDRVRCSAPPDVLTAERRAELARRKAEIEALLKAARAAAPGSIVPIETGGSRLPFYAVPGHNGDVFCFVRLARCLGTDRAFYGLQPPGLDGTSPCTTIEELAGHFVRELLEHQPEGPYQLGGYCLGGLTAFEMARQLRRMNLEVRALVLFGTMSPPALRPANRAKLALAQWSGDRIRGARAFADLSGRDRVLKVKEKVLASVTPDEQGRDEAGPADELTRAPSACRGGDACRGASVSPRAVRRPGDAVCAQRGVHTVARSAARVGRLRARRDGRLLRSSRL